MNMTETYDKVLELVRGGMEITRAIHKSGYKATEWFYKNLTTQQREELHMEKMAFSLQGNVDTHCIAMPKFDKERDMKGDSLLGFSDRLKNVHEYFSADLGSADNPFAWERGFGLSINNA